MTDTIPEVTKQEASITILEKCVCLVLKCQGLGNTRAIPTKLVDIEKDHEKVDDKEKASLRLTKELVNKDVLKPGNAILTSLKAFMVSESTPAHNVFGDSTYLVAYRNLSKVLAKLKTTREELKDFRTGLAAEWPAIIEAKKGNKFFNLADFPTVDDILGDSYDIDWNYQQFGAPDKLEEVDKAAYEEAQEKWDGLLQSAFDEVVDHFRGLTLSVFEELANKLGADKNGKPKALKPQALRDLQDLIKNLPVLNVGNDGKLLDIIAPVAALAEGATVDALKAPAYRKLMKEAAENAVKNLDSIVTLKPTRRIFVDNLPAPAATAA